MSLINFPVLYINDPEKGRPLFYGQIFVGITDLDPEIPANRKQLRIAQEDGTKIDVPQPFVLSAGGVPVYNGATVRLDVDGNYSLKILDRNGEQAYYIHNVLEGEGEPITNLDLINNISQAYDFDTVALMASSSLLFPLKKKLTVKGNVAIGDGENADYVISASQSDIDHDVQLSNGNWANWQHIADNQVTATVYQEAPTDAQIQTVIDGANATGKITILGESVYTRGVNWKGFEHEPSDLPFKLGSFPITGGDLNGRMTVANGMLYNCAFSNNRVEIFTLIDPRFPELVTSFPTSSQPRHVDIVGRFALVCCHGANKIEVFDLSNQTAPSLVGTIDTGAGPKMFEIAGNELFVVCNGANTIEKYKFLLPSENSLFSSEKLGEAGVQVPLCCAFNDEGLLVVCGLDANIRLVGSSTMNLISTTAIPGGGSHGTCVWINKSGVLVTDATQGGVHFVNYNDISSPSVDAFISTVANPEQIEVVGNRCYIPGLTTPAKMSVLDITDAAHPFEYKQVDLSVNGAGFTAYNQVGNNGYVYINGHFSPFNIDVIEVEVGNGDDTPKNVNENIYARIAGFSEADIGNLIAHIDSITEKYRTATSNTNVDINDNILRIGNGANADLFDPELKPGKRVVITNVHAVSTSDVTNAFLGFSGTLDPLASVILVSMDTGGVFQWDAISSHGTIT